MLSKTPGRLTPGARFDLVTGYARIVRVLDFEVCGGEPVTVDVADTGRDLRWCSKVSARRHLDLKQFLLNPLLSELEIFDATLVLLVVQTPLRKTA